jgi:uncharacterized membrane protein YqhA
MKSMSRALQQALWWSRYAVFVPVVGGVLMAFAAIWMGATDDIYVLTHLRAYATAGHDAKGDFLRVSLLTTIVEAFDIYLIAALFLIFALGLYELFIGKLEVAEDSSFAARLLIVRDLDDLKDRLAKLVLVILMVEILRQALQLTYNTSTDVLYLGLATALAGGTFWLATHVGSGGKSEPAATEPNTVAPPTPTTSDRRAARSTTDSAADGAAEADSKMGSRLEPLQEQT